MAQQSEFKVYMQTLDKNGRVHRHCFALVNATSKAKACDIAKRNHPDKNILFAEPTGRKF
jgi:predicted house-cleaning NTP pyrophosphatase (Maf/HAM1 superfamily)